MWDIFEPLDNQWYRWDVNGASAFLHKHEDSWQILCKQIAFDHFNDTFGGPHLVDAPETDKANISFIVGKGKKAAIKPCFDGLPYLVTLKDKIRIMPGAEIRFSVRLPPLLRFELSGCETPLAEQMPFLLSRTWFGDGMAGTLCYSLPSPLYSLGDEKNPIDSNVSSLITCTVFVHNTSKTELDLKQAVIYTDMLNVYEKNATLFTDNVALDNLNDGNLKMSVYHIGQNRGFKKLSSSISGGKSEMFVRRGAEFLKTMTSI